MEFVCQVDREFAVKNQIYDLAGLENLQFILFEIFKQFKNSQSKVSSEEMMAALRQTSDIIGSWEPLTYLDSELKIELFYLLNLPDCFEGIIRYLENITSRIEELLQEAELDQIKQIYLQYLATINEHITRISYVLTSKFALYPPFSDAGITNFHFRITSWNFFKKIMTESQYRFFRPFAKRGIPLPMKVTTLNTKFMRETEKVTYSDLIHGSTDTICQICRTDLAEVQNLSFSIVCKHVCCSVCLARWFSITQMKQQVW